MRSIFEKKLMIIYLSFVDKNNSVCTLCELTYIFPGTNADGPGFGSCSGVSNNKDGNEVRSRLCEGLPGLVHFSFLALDLRTFIVVFLLMATMMKIFHVLCLFAIFPQNSCVFLYNNCLIYQIFYV